MQLAPQRSTADRPPEPLQMMPDEIPLELKIRPQWVNWKYAWDGKRWTKHPYNPRTGHKASTTDLLTWSPFEEVLEAYEAGMYNGAGFVLCSGDPYTAVDLDYCRDVQTGEIERWAMEIIDGLDSYTELSPSGKGIHVFVRGKVPVALNLPHIEMYSAERYFTMTGRIAEVRRD